MPSRRALPILAGSASAGLLCLSGCATSDPVASSLKQAAAAQSSVVPHQPDDDDRRDRRCRARGSFLVDWSDMRRLDDDGVHLCDVYERRPSTLS